MTSVMWEKYSISTHIFNSSFTAFFVSEDDVTEICAAHIFIYPSFFSLSLFVSHHHSGCPKALIVCYPTDTIDKSKIISH